MVLVVNGPRGSEVTACSSRAVAQGVRPGMPLVEAQTLVRGLGVAPYEPNADRAVLVKWAEACERFSPRVAIEEGPAPDSLMFDISNLEHLGKTDAQLARQVKKFFTTRGYLVRLGVGETVGEAWAIAHFGDDGNPKSHLPVQALRIADETAVMLRDLGVETVGQLQGLPREELSARFGSELLRRLDQLTGAGREVIEPRRAPTPFEASYALEEPTADRAMLVYVLKQLVDKLAQQLAACNQGAVLLIGSLHGSDAPPLQLRIGLLQPSASARQLMELVELHSTLR